MQSKTHSLLIPVLLLLAFAYANTSFAQESNENMVLVGKAGEKTKAYVPCKVADPHCDATELKAVELDAFYIDKYETTYADIVQCLESGKCTKNDELLKRIKDYMGNHPGAENLPYDYSVGLAQNIGQDLARDYCKALGKRLPSPEEWLLAAMGSQIQAYPWGNDKTDGIYASKISAVGSFPRDLSVWGAYDMGGNAGEWVEGKRMGKEYEAGTKCLPEFSYPAMGNAKRIKVYERFGETRSVIEEDFYVTSRCAK
ncbi:MAG: formylglycine-generating enzyme family protein [Bradymonadia bacterium]|jgi:formylglycine-generating enzyme required for sulfatase activity